MASSLEYYTLEDQRAVIRFSFSEEDFFIVRGDEMWIFTRLDPRKNFGEGRDLKKMRMCEVNGASLVSKSK